MDPRIGHVAADKRQFGLLGEHRAGEIVERAEFGMHRIVAAGPWLPEVRRAILPADPKGAPFLWLRQSFALVPGLLAEDRSAQQASIHSGQGRYGALYWQLYLASQGPGVKEQLSASAERTAQMILWAWTLAGSPPPPPS